MRLSRSPSTVNVPPRIPKSDVTNSYLPLILCATERSRGHQVKRKDKDTQDHRGEKGSQQRHARPRSGEGRKTSKHADQKIRMLLSERLC
eukprot:38009-Eustigmatos_ZCMA.PRE.1